MSAIDTVTIRLVELEPMRVACAHGFSKSPEGQAWEELTDWCRSAGIDPWDGSHRFFGHNDPAPDRHGAPYGYRQCITISDDFEVGDGPVTAGRLGGGRWATVRCHGLDTIADGWRRLASWTHDQGLRHRHTDGLEELLSADPETPDEYLFDLYLPIE